MFIWRIIPLTKYYSTMHNYMMMYREEGNARNTHMWPNYRCKQCIDIIISKWKAVDMNNTPGCHHIVIDAWRVSVCTLYGTETRSISQCFLLNMLDCIIINARGNTMRICCLWNDSQCRHKSWLINSVDKSWVLTVIQLISNDTPLPLYAVNVSKFFTNNDNSLFRQELCIFLYKRHNRL